MNLTANSVAELALDGTLVYVEALESVYAAVVALPEQTSVKVSQVFNPGSVRAKKISPFSQAARLIELSELTPANLQFVQTFRDLRTSEGPNHRVGGASPGGDDVTVTKMTMKKIREKCVTCGEQRGHFNHPGTHEFVPPAAEAPSAPAPTRSKRSTASAPSLGGRYKLVSTDLTAAKSQPKGERYEDGNRSFRVVRALEGLPERTGTLEEIIVALVRDGNKMPSDPEKVVKRTLAQLVTEPFGSIVVRA